MVHGYHIILGAYGFWLPNDPRGSWSSEVWAENIRAFGTATKVTTRRSVAAREHDVGQRFAAKDQLLYPPVRFSGIQARAVVRGFAAIAAKLEIIVHACAIQPEHVHLVIARHNRDAEDLAGFLKRAGTRQLTVEGLNPMQPFARLGRQMPSPWAQHGWVVFLDTPERMRQAIRYVEDNPLKAGLRRQKWGFVVPYKEYDRSGEQR
jgi:REP element-mobilizing transposase RayT